MQWLFSIVLLTIVIEGVKTTMTRVIRKVKYEYGRPIITDFFPNEQVERCGTCVHLVEHVKPIPPFDREHIYTCEYANNLDYNLCEEYKLINPFDRDLW